MGKIVGRKLQDMPNLDFVYYFGSMSTAGKAKSLDAFEKKREVKVMVRRNPGIPPRRTT